MLDPCQGNGVAVQLLPFFRTRARTYSKRPGSCSIGSVNFAFFRMTDCFFRPDNASNAGFTKISKVTKAETGLPGNPKK